MIDCGSVARYSDSLCYVKTPTVLLESIHKINRAKAQEVLRPGNISKLVLYKTHFNIPSHQRVGLPRSFQFLGLPRKSYCNISYLQRMLHGSPIILDFYYLVTSV